MDIDNEYLSWKRYALCWQLVDMQILSADLWFSDESTVGAKKAADICFQCPVRQQCLGLAQETKEPYGIWGGLPPSIRTAKRQTLKKQKLLPNPYNTEDLDSPFHIINLLEEDSDE